MSSVRLPNGLSADNIIATPTRGLTRAKNRPPNASPSPTPKTHPTTRANVNGTRNVDYDMKHHPMDLAMRPKAAAKRAAVKSSTASTTDIGSNKLLLSGGSKSKTMALKTTTSKSVERKPAAKNIPAKRELSTLLDKPLAYAWSDLAPIDRRIFCLQAGAPAGGKTLPFKWPRLADQLDQEGLLTKVQLKACGGAKALLERYELVRLHVQGLFGAADEATDRTDFNILYAEGFDVYDLVGSKTAYVHPRDRDPVAEHTAKKSKVDHKESGGADSQTDTATAQDTQVPVAFAAERSPRFQSEESGEISYEEQVWGPGGFRPEELRDNGDYVGSMEQSREDVSALIEDVMSSQDDVSKVYEEHLSQMQATDIILSDRSSAARSDEHGTGGFEREPQDSGSAVLSEIKTAHYSSNFAIPVANMTGNMPDPQTGRPVTLKEGPLKVTVNLPSQGDAASDQLLKDLETQGSDGPEPGSSTFAQQSRAKWAVNSFQVFEDQDGSTPVVKKSVILHHLSPGTDIPKENFENDGDGDNDHTSQSMLGRFGARTHHTQIHHRGVNASTSATERTQSELELPGRSPTTNSMFDPFTDGAADDSLATITTSGTHRSSLYAPTNETIVSTSEDGSNV